MRGLEDLQHIVSYSLRTTQHQTAEEKLPAVQSQNQFLTKLMRKLSKELYN